MGPRKRYYEMIIAVAIFSATVLRRACLIIMAPLVFPEQGCCRRPSARLACKSRGVRHPHTQGCCQDVEYPQNRYPRLLRSSDFYRTLGRNQQQDQNTPATGIRVQGQGLFYTTYLSTSHHQVRTGGIRSNNVRSALTRRSRKRPAVLLEELHAGTAD